MYKEPFIGTGHNPEGPDMPMGFGMLLAQDPQAVETYGKLDDRDKAAVIEYVQDVKTGGEAKAHIKNALNNLHNGQMPGNSI